MAIPKKKFREILLLILYSRALTQSYEQSLETLIMKELSVTKKSVKQAREKAELILDKQEKIDTLITQTTRSYDLSRIQIVEKNILRLGIYEIVFEKILPPKVVISEAIRLAKKFSTPEATSFVHAILDAVYKQTQGEESPVTDLSGVFDALKKSEEIAHEAAQTKKESDGPRKLPFE